MNDLLEEAKQELRNQQLMAVFKKYGSKLLILGILGIIIAIALSYYNESVDNKLAKAGDEYYKLNSADKLSDEDLDKFIADAPSGYKELAQFKKAAKLISENKREDALKVYESISKQSGQKDVFRDLAEINIAYEELNKDNTNLEDISKRLAALSGSGRPFASMAKELEGFVLVKQGKKDEAAEYFYNLSKSQASTPAMVQRTQIIAESLKPGIIADNSSPAGETGNDLEKAQ